MKKFTAKTVVVIAIGAALYGVGGLIGIPVFANTTLKPAIAILGIFSAIYGPVVGFFVGALGHILTDLFSGWGVWFSWVLGSGIVGLIGGFYLSATKDSIGRGLFTVKYVFAFILLAFVGNFVGYSISALIDFIAYKEPVNKIMTQQLIIATTNTILTAIIGSIVLALVAKRNKLETNLSVSEE